MKKTILLLITFMCSLAFADEFVCRHQDSAGNKYVVEHLNGSICMKISEASGGERKFNLFPAPNAQYSDGLIVYRDDENSFRLILTHVPSPGDPAQGEVVHTDTGGEVIPENMSTYCQ